MYTSQALNRKHQLTEYRDLFTALFKISDKDVQQRIIYAINDVNYGKKQLHDVGTQTETIIETTINKTITIEQQQQQQDEKIPSTVNNINYGHSPIKDEYLKFLKINEEKDLQNSINQENKISRKKRRTKRVPTVVKHDPFATNTKRMKLCKPNEEHNGNGVANANKIIPNLLDFYSSNEIEDAELSLLQPKQDFDIIKQMKKEYEVSEIYNGDYYPIHEAIIDNDINKFKRQIYVFDKKRKNINELRTKKNETLIQLAIKFDSYDDIIDTLLENVFDIEQVDRNGNTLLHLTIIYTDNIKLLKYFLNKINLNFMLKYNDDGLSALHIAVRTNKFRFCKALIDTVNIKLNIKTVGINVDNNKILEDLYSHEIRVMLHKRTGNIDWNEKKYEIINQRDQKHNRTALFFALEKKIDKSIIFLLLVNLADPNMEDRSGIDCISYARDNKDNNYLVDHYVFTCLLNTSDYLRKLLFTHRYG